MCMRLEIPNKSALTKEHIKESVFEVFLIQQLGFVPFIWISFSFLPHMNHMVREVSQLVWKMRYQKKNSDISYEFSSVEVESAI